MRGLLFAALCLGAAAVAACRIEDHTPAGSRRDEDAVQEIVARYARRLSARDWDDVRALFWRNGTYSGPMIPRSAGNALSIDSALHVIARTVEGPEAATFHVRVLRTDLRQEGDLAAVWVTLRRRMPLPGCGAGRARLGGAPGAPPDRNELADPQRGGLVGAERKSS